MVASLEQRLTEAVGLHIEGRLLDAAWAYFDCVRGLSIAESPYYAQAEEGLRRGDFEGALCRLGELLDESGPLQRSQDARIANRIWNVRSRSLRRVGGLDQMVAVGSAVPVSARFPVRFGCLADADFLNDEALRLWGTILESVPHSKLILLASGAEANALGLLLGKYGLSDEQVSVMSLGAAEAQPLVDVLLDTLPASNPERVCDSLLAGRPVVTRRGAHPANDISERILDSIGCDRWVASDNDAYVSIACSLGTDKQLLALESRSLIERLGHESPLVWAVQALRLRAGLQRSPVRSLPSPGERVFAPGAPLEGTGRHVRVS